MTMMKAKTIINDILSITKTYVDHWTKLHKLAEGIKECTEIDFIEMELPLEPVKDFYDVALEEIGAKPEDCKIVREALEWRLT